MRPPEQAVMHSRSTIFSHTLDPAFGFQLSVFQMDENREMFYSCFKQDKEMGNVTFQMLKSN